MDGAEAAQCDTHHVPLAHAGSLFTHIVHTPPSTRNYPHGGLYLCQEQTKNPVSCPFACVSTRGRAKCQTQCGSFFLALLRLTPSQQLHEDHQGGAEHGELVSILSG